MPRRTYLIEQAAKARRLAGAIGCPRTNANLEAYATECERECDALEQKAALDAVTKRNKA